MKMFSSYDDLWQALLALNSGEDVETWRYEEQFIAFLEGRFGPAGKDWEVLEISASVPAFLINLSLALMDAGVVHDFRTVLSRTLPGVPVLVHLFDGDISAPESRSTGAAAIFTDDLWCRGQCPDWQAAG